MKQPTNNEQYRAMMADLDGLLAKTAQGGASALNPDDMALVGEMSRLIAAYEDSIPLLPFEAPRDMVQMIQYKMVEQNLTQRATASLLAIHESRLSEILNRRRPLNLEIAKQLYAKLGIPAVYILEHA